MARAITLSTSGEVSVKEFEVGNSYDTISAGVGGWIECVHLPSLGGMDMWVNEEGKLNGLPRNLLATAIWTIEYGVTDVIVGNVVFTGGVDDEGETLGLSDEQLAELQKLLSFSLV